MPLGDVEANPNGFNRTLIRPNFFLAANAEQGKIYYDHSVVGGGFATTDFDYEGCTTDCNTWDPNDGNQN
jgi:hypothetical protein